MNKLPEYRRRRRALSVPAGDGAMTVNDELRELADHELDVMRGRLEALVRQWASAEQSHADMANMVEQQMGLRHTLFHGQRDMLAVCLRQLRNVLAGRDAEDDGR